MSDNKKSKSEATLTGICAGIIGFVTGMHLGPLNPPSRNDKAKNFQDGTPRIFRTYENYRSDHIYVEYPDNSNEYITLEKYLKIRDTKKKDEIKKTSGW